MAQLNSTLVQGNLTVTNKAQASNFVKIGGTNSQLLVADGGVKTFDELKTSLGLKSAAYTESSAYATAAQGTVASTAVQTAKFGSKAFTKNETEISITQADARAALGLGGAAYKAENYYQPADADLTAIAGLTGPSGLLKKTAADTWTLDTNTYLTTGGTAANSSKLGGVAAASYATQDWVDDNYTNNTGTVTSVKLTVPTGLTVTDQPITTSGTLAISFATGYSIPTTAKQSNWDTAYGWGNHASAGYLPLTAGSGKKITGYLYSQKPIGITGNFDSNTIPTDVVGVAYLAYNSSYKALEFVFN